MSIQHKTSGDIFEEQVDAIVNPVNCVGVMGAGLALQFKKRFTDNFDAYVEACNQGLKPGQMFIFETGLPVPKYIVNFPTEDRARSKMEFIESGLAALLDDIKTLGIKSIAIPALGCGIGGLSWDKVKPLIDKAFEGVDGVEVVVFAPR